MAPIAIVTIASSMLLVYAFFRKKIPKTYDAGLVDTLVVSSTPISPKLLKVSFATLVAIDVGYVLASLCRIPVSLVVVQAPYFSWRFTWLASTAKSSVASVKGSKA